MPSDLSEMTVIEHLEELRRRLLIIVAVTIISIFITFPISGRVLKQIKQDLMPVDVKLAALTVLEGVQVQFKIAIFLSLFVILPTIGAYEFFAFISPGLVKKEKKTLYTTIPPIAILFLCGCLLAYYVLLPVMIQFFLTYNNQLGLDSILSINFFVSFVFTTMLATGLMFEFPLVIGILSYIGVVSPKTLSYYRRHIYIALLIIAAVITPDPTIMSMTILSIPMLILFELGILVAKMVNR